LSLNKVIRYLVIALVVLVFLAALATYTVKFNETAVVSTWGKADADSVRTTEGLGFIFPYVQKVTKYDKRVRYVEPAPETVQTSDQRQLIVTLGMTWRVSDPFKFYKSMSGKGQTAQDHYQFAEDILKLRVRQVKGLISQKRLNEIISSTQDGSALSSLESSMLKALQTPSADNESLSEMGVEATSVVIVGFGLPADTTTKVFDGMNKARERIANEAITQGTSEATTIRSSAENDAKRISAFADRLAKSLRAQGDAETQVYLRQMKDDPDLAVFIRNMEFMRASMGKTTTLVLPTSMPGMEWFRPDAINRAQSGLIPGMNFDRLAPFPAAKPSASAASDSTTGGGSSTSNPAPAAQADTESNP
jgi:membrane protease subunit HflC